MIIVSIKTRILRRLRAWVKPTTRTPTVGALTDLTRSRSALIAENMLLRQQLIIVERQIKRPKLTWWDRALLVFLASRFPHWKDALLIVQPETLLRWHRDLFRFVWRHKSKPKRPPGRPPLPQQTVTLIRQMVSENVTWGAKRIRGELLKLGLIIAKSTIQRYIRERRPVHPQHQSWLTFLHNHASAIWACDLLQTYDILFRALFVFVIIDLASRRIVHWGVTRHPTDAWLAQQVRNATAFGVGPRYLIRDNDGKYGTRFDRAVTGAGILVRRTPVEAPKANAICERFWGSLRRECLDHLIILSEAHLRQILRDYTRYFNVMRPHQGMAQRIPDGPMHPAAVDGPVETISFPILGGLHHHYERKAA